MTNEANLKPLPPSGDRAGAWILLGLFSICLLLGGILAAVGWVQLEKAKSASAWPSVDAAITTSRVSERWEMDQNKRLVPTQLPEIEFEYSVDGTTYRGTHLNASGATSNDLGVLERYPLGAHVTAYYNPSNPADAALSTDVPALGYILLGVGVLVLLIGTPFAYFAFRRFLRSKKA